MKKKFIRSWLITCWFLRIWR